MKFISTVRHNFMDQYGEFELEEGRKQMKTKKNPRITWIVTGG